MATQTLTSADVENLVDRDEMRRAMAAAHRDVAAGAACQPAPHALPSTPASGEDRPTIVPMTAMSHVLGLFSVKVLADAPGNRARGLPAQRSTVAVFDSASAECVALVDGRALTRVRTAAVTALATDVLAPADSRTVALIGSGPLAQEHARALMRVRGIERFLVWSRERARAEACVADLRIDGIPADAVDEIGEATAGAQVVCTLTPAAAPFLTAAVLAADAHVNAVGSPPRPGFSELHPEVFAGAERVIVDDRAVAIAESGNVRAAIAAGTVAPAALIELGEALAETAARSEGRTVFNSVGLGVQDLYAAALLLRRAREVDAGTIVHVRD